MFLLRSLLQEIIREGAVTLIGPDGRGFLIGKGEPSVAIRVADPAAIPSFS
jgi:hypothetical protein